MARDYIRDDSEHHTDGDKAQEGAYKAEHSLAWAMVVLALVLGAIGLLVGFGILGSEEVPAAATPDGALDTNVTTNWEQGMLWLLPAIAAGLLALTLHQTEHHTRPAPRDKANKGLFGTEHTLAYIGVVAAIGAGALTLLIGFDVFDRGYSPEDGFLWGAGAILSGVVSSALHRTRHHQMMAEQDEDYIVSVVEERIRMAPVDRTAGTTTTTPATGTRSSTMRDRPLDR